MSWDDARVQIAMASLVEKGFHEDALKTLSTEQILSVIGHKYPVEAVNLAGCLKHAEQKKSLLDLFSKFHKYVGKVHVEFTVESVVGDGSCVLIGGDGLTATCLHVCKFDGDLKSKRKASPPKISVTYPFGCTRVRRDGTVVSTSIEFRAEVVFSDEENDVALLLPSSPKRFKDLDFFYWWSAGNPRHTDTILLISYPNLLQEEYPLDKGSKAGDMPSSCIGFTTYINPSQLVASYTSFAGSSGGLVINVAEYDGHYGIGLHSGAMSDFKPLKQWGQKELALLNENLEKKAYLGIATRGIPSIVHAFRTHTKMTKQLGQKVAVTLKATKESEGSLRLSKRKVELAAIDQSPFFDPSPGCLHVNKRKVELATVDELPLFGPWPGDDGYVTE